MFKRGLSEADKNEREGIVSHLLIKADDVPEARFSVSWVEVAAGGIQDAHAHDAEQAYLVVGGRGRMRVGDKEMEVAGGEVVHVPAGVSHGMENASDEELSYVTIAAPASEEEVL